MNYYPRHIGDYIKDTAHLSLLEHGIYARLLDVYYSREAPIPADQVMRLIGARSEDERAATAAVLTEFFTADGSAWRHSRCDSEIARMQDKQATSEAKAEHESERMRRHRDRRASLFAQLRERGVVPAWDTPITALQRMADDPTTDPKPTHNEPATHLQREQEPNKNAPATAIPTPTPTPTPTPKKEEAPQRERGSRLPPDWKLPPEWEAWARANRPDLDPQSTAAQFADFWHSKPGKDGVKLDWLATWRVWVRGEKAPRQAWSKQDTSVTVPGESNDAYLARMAAERAAEDARVAGAKGPPPELLARVRKAVKEVAA